MYKYDMHVHTAETSHCGKVNAKVLIHMYKNAGYTGVVITDHFHKFFFQDYQKYTWEERMNYYLKGYRNALKEGKLNEVDVFLGMEIRFLDSPNDYLVYGVTEDFLLNNQNLHKHNLKSFKELIKKYNMLIYQAHPFRPEQNPDTPHLLDGIEVYNGNPRHNSRNDMAYDFALEHNLKMISGSDFHQPEDLAKGGIIFCEKINNNNHLIEILKKDTIQLIRALD